jgi:hypothetical protein
MTVGAIPILIGTCLPIPPPGQESLKFEVSGLRLVNFKPEKSQVSKIKKNPPPSGQEDFRAEDRARTGHPDLGKVVLYQMSYFRKDTGTLFRSILLSERPDSYRDDFQRTKGLQK